MKNKKIELLKQAIEFKYLTLEVIKKQYLDEIKTLTVELEQEFQQDESYAPDFLSTADFQFEITKTERVLK